MRDFILAAILLLTGASSAEDLDESTLERFEALEARPLPVNMVPPSRLLSSGLFTAYQVASLSDYRSRCGDVLSVEELALIDGFAGGVARALEPFISFDSRNIPGAPAKDTLIFRNTLVGKGSFRTGARAGYGVKDRFSIEGVFESSVVYSPNGLKANATVYGRRRPWKMVFGDYNLRYGQGLSLWSGFEMSGIYGISSLTKRPSGISPSFSYSAPGARRGIAAEAGFGRHSAALFVSTDAFRDVSAGGAWSLLFPAGQVGCHIVGDNLLRSPSLRISADASINIKGYALAGEVAVQALKGRVAGLVSFSTPSYRGFRIGTRAIVRPSGYSGRKYGEYAVALAGEYAGGRYVPVSGRTGFGSSELRHKGVFSVSAEALPVKGGDTSRKRLKAVLQYSCRLSPNVLAQAKAYTYLYTYQASRHGFRADLQTVFGRWSADARLEMAFSKRYGLLSYIEGGYCGKYAKGFFRVTGFAADAWADRVYCYERDISGSFSAPAYSGRGVSLSAFGACSFRLRRRFTLKFSTRGFLTMKKPAPWKAGLNFQGEFIF